MHSRFNMLQHQESKERMLLHLFLLYFQSITIKTTDNDVVVIAVTAVSNIFKLGES